MSRATPDVQRKLEHLCLKRAALNLVINSLEKYSRIVHFEHDGLLTCQSEHTDESILTCAIRAWQTPGPDRPGWEAVTRRHSSTTGRA